MSGLATTLLTGVDAGLNQPESVCLIVSGTRRAVSGRLATLVAADSASGTLVVGLGVAGTTAVLLAVRQDGPSRSRAIAVTRRVRSGRGVAGFMVAVAPFGVTEDSSCWEGVKARVDDRTATSVQWLTTNPVARGRSDYVGRLTDGGVWDILYAFMVKERTVGSTCSSSYFVTIESVLGAQGRACRRLAGIADARAV